MPGAQIVAVVSQAGRPREGPEIVVVAGGPRRAVVVIPWGWTSARLMPPPRGVIAVRVVPGRAVGIRVVASPADSPRNVVEQSRRGFGVAVGYVSGAHQHHGGARWSHRDGRGAALPFTRRRDRRRARRYAAHEPAAVDRRGRRVAALPGHGPAHQRIAVRVLGRGRER